MKPYKLAHYGEPDGPVYLLSTMSKLWTNNVEEWKAYQDWLAAGNTPEPADPPPAPPVPDSITRLQFFQHYANEFPEDISEAEALAVAGNGKVPAIFESAVFPQAPESERFGLRMYVSSALYFERNDPKMKFIVNRLGMDDTAANLFFTDAAKI